MSDTAQVDHPGSRRITLAPQLPNQGLKPSPFSRGQAPKCQTNTLTLAAGAEDCFTMDFDVDWWVFGVVVAASVRCNVVTAPSAAGPGWIFGGGGKANIPGSGNTLSVRNTGSNPITVVAVATVGYPAQLSYDPGDLA